MVTKKPTPEKYGLFGDINMLEKLLEAKAVSKQRKRESRYLILILIVTSVFIAKGVSSGGKPQIPFYIGAVSIFFVGFLQMLLIKAADGKTILEKDQTYQTIQKYKNDMQKYEIEMRTTNTNKIESLASAKQEKYSQSTKSETKAEEFRKQDDKPIENTGKPTNFTLDEAAYLKAKKVHRMKLIKTLAVCTFCALLVFYGVTAGQIWPGVVIIPGIGIIAYLLFLILNRPIKNIPDTYKHEKEWLLQTDERFLMKPKVKLVLDKEAYKKAFNHSVLMTLIALGLLAFFSSISALAYDENKWYLVFALLPAIWSFTYIIVMIFMWPSRDDIEYYRPARPSD